MKGKRVSGIEKVFINLCKSFDQMGIAYKKNQKFRSLKAEDKVIVLGIGKDILNAYQQPNQIIAGIALVSHPSEWTTMLEDYPIAKYLQHSAWAEAIYISYYGQKVCDVWFAGIETEKWKPPVNENKAFDFLIYNKIKSKYDADLLMPIKNQLEAQGYTFKEIIYGHYKEKEYFNLLSDCKAMIYLSEHESQGFAYQEAMSMNVPILAWNQGYWLDPNLGKWNNNMPIPASSVPYFNAYCGETFVDFAAFKDKLPLFLSRMVGGKYQPRQYVIENLSLAKSAKRMLQIIDEVYETEV
ncbi:glycosyltransferase [Pedobacter yonginense]|nr:glycosyltransferase [Pedobacter yonginense]